MSIGTLPLPDAETAMSWQLDIAGEHALFITSGETKERQNWVVDVMVNGLPRNPGLLRLKPGRFRGYWDTPIFVKRPGRKLTLDLPYAQYAAEEWPLFQKLQSQPGNERLQFQFGMPDPLQIPALATGLLSQYSVFEQALAHEATQIRRMGGRHLTIQWEVVIQQIVTRLAEIAGQRAVQKAVNSFARRIVRLVELLPRGTNIAFHFCYGDLGNKSIMTAPSTAASVELINAIAAIWPRDYPLQYVHIPMAFGCKTPPEGTAFYAPLRHLELLPETRIAAGFAHERASYDEQKRTLDAVEDFLLEPVMVSAACGEGRRSLDAARRLAERKLALAAS